jgi:hypothetical protein
MHYAANEGAEPVRVSVASILPKSAALTISAAQVPAALPRTGTADDRILLWLLAIGGAAIIAATWALRRATQRRR